MGTSDKLYIDTTGTELVNRGYVTDSVLNVGELSILFKSNGEIEVTCRDKVFLFSESKTMGFLEKFSDAIIIK